MKKTLIIVGAIVAFLFFFIVLPILVGVGYYNKMVNQDETVKSQWAQVENVYQRRSDLIPNLVSTVKGYADFEKSTLTQVQEARSNATSIKIDANHLNPENIQKFQAAQTGLTSALSRLMMVTENYPNLKANENFLQLQAQLEGTENRIAVERMKFNEVAKNYNTYIRQFPKNIVAGIGGFQQKGYFEAEKGSNVAPKVKF